MRHRYKKTTDLVTGIKKKDIVVRELLTSLVKYGKVTISPKRAKVLKAEADSFFAKLVATHNKFAEAKDAQRECGKIIKSTIYGEAEGKKVLNELLPRYAKEKKVSGFVADYKVGFRVWDASLKVLITLA